MFKVIVVYKTKYGNTKKVAETIMDGMMELEGIEGYIGDVEETDPHELEGYDLTMIGSPNHIGRATRSVNKFIDEMAKASLDGKWFAVFDTCVPGDYGKAVKKMEKMLEKKLPKMRKATEGLSVKVGGMKGPIAEGELERCRQFGKDTVLKIKG